jgi:glycosyltransferase involved in cell wall biosynthesis
MPSKVSILMPAYNVEKYIGDSIQSILEQTFSDFELIIINDGSTDKTASIISKFDDKRIKYLENPQNSGLSFTRNRLIGEASGIYLAWLDADDIALPQRLEKQVKRLDQNPNLAFVASWARLIDAENQPTGAYIKSYIPNQYLGALLLFVNYIVQSSVVIRRDKLPEIHYDSAFPPTEDYELWTRILRNHQAEILPEVLVNYRVHTTNISHVQSDKASSTVMLNHRNQLLQLGLNPSVDDLDLHYQIGFRKLKSIEQIQQIEVWFQAIEKANETSQRFDNQALNFILSHRWARICTQNPAFGLKALKFYFKSRFKKVTLQNVLLILVYVFKTLFKK